MPWANKDKWCKCPDNNGRRGNWPGDHQQGQGDLGVLGDRSPRWTHRVCYRGTGVTNQPWPAFGVTILNRHPVRNTQQVGLEVTWICAELTSNILFRQSCHSGQIKNNRPPPSPIPSRQEPRPIKHSLFLSVE